MTLPAPRIPHPSRLAADNPHFQEIVSAHCAALASGLALYRDPVTGYWVFTAQAHLDRGNCCETGCRHCPYIETEST